MRSLNALLAVTAAAVLSLVSACDREQAAAPFDMPAGAPVPPAYSEPPAEPKTEAEPAEPSEAEPTFPAPTSKTSTASDSKLKVERRKKYTDIDCTTLLSPADVEEAVGLAGAPPKVVGSKGNACLAGSSMGDAEGATVNYSTSNRNISTTGDPFEIAGNSAFRKKSGDRICAVSVALDERGDYTLGAGLEVEVGMQAPGKDACAAATKLTEKAFAKIPDA